MDEQAGTPMEVAVTVPATKLQAPIRRTDSLLRLRLVEALQSNVERKLQIVVAPAGFGKSTLLVDFADQSALPYCWATLDRDDATPAAFLETVIATLARRFPGFGKRLAPALRSPADIERRAGAIARTFAAEVESHVDGLTLLFLDDFHEVNDALPVTTVFDEILRLLPDTLRVVLAGRTWPNLTVSRLLVDGQLFGLGEADLRFTSDELLSLLRRLDGPDLLPEQATQLADGSEGWIAGFLLSVPRLRQGLAGGLQATGGGNGPLYAYLATEAFERQPAELQHFLLASSIPDVADEATCQALLGPGNWRAMVDRAEAAGLFVTRLQGRRGAFRYHQLFRSFLQERLRQTDVDAYHRWHGSLAAELASRQEWSAALAHFRLAGQEARAAELLAAAVPDLERLGRWRLIAEAGAFAPEVLDQYPRLMLASARAAMMLSDLKQAETLAERGRCIGEQANDRSLQAWGVTYLAKVRRLQGRTGDGLRLLHQAVALEPPDADLLAMIHLDIGTSMGMQGDFTGAITELRAALTGFDQAGLDQDAARAEHNLGIALVKSGQPAEAIARYRSALERWRAIGDASMEAEMLNALGCAHGYRGDYDLARGELEEALRLSQGEGNTRTAGAVLHSLAEVMLATGDVQGAKAMLQRALPILHDLGELWVLTHAYDALALSAAFERDLTRAEELAHHAVALAERQESRFLTGKCRLTLGCIYSRRGAHKQAITTLAAATEQFIQMNADREAAHACLWLAQALQAAGDHDQSCARLREALQIANRLGADAVLDLHLRWDSTLFSEAAVNGIEQQRLVAALRRIGGDAPAQSPPNLAVLPSFSACALGEGELLTESGGVVAWPWDRVREVFFLLLHNGPRRQEQLCETLWPDAPPAKSRTGLYTAIYRLRRSIHQQVIVLQGGLYRINEDLITSYDVRDFDRLIKSATGAGGPAIDQLQRAVNLYGGPFLSDVDADWCDEVRSRLGQQYSAALLRLADAYLAGGRPRESVIAIERLIAYDPLREDAYARGVRAYLKLGDRPGARRLIDRCVQTLRDELGVEPGAEVVTLARRLSA